MTGEGKKALVSRPDSEIAGPYKRRSPVLERMTRDVLSRAQARDLSAARFRVGEYELRQPDYRQILRWAKQLDMLPEYVLTQLVDSRMEPKFREDREPIAFSVEDGAIVSLVWDFDRLPSIPSVWESGLLVRRLGLTGQWPDIETPLQPFLPHLQILRCQQIGLHSLVLSSAQQLAVLDCGVNKLTELDLTPVQRLTELHCWGNQLTELDLTPVPLLTELWCGYNQLNELDLSSVPLLTELRCSQNHQLTELDLLPVQGLTLLDCSYSELAELDLSPVPGLNELSCNGNPLISLDLSPVPLLMRLSCIGCSLTTLDFSSVPELKILTRNPEVQLLNPPIGLIILGG